jgi:hypothetical protein
VEHPADTNTDTIEKENITGYRARQIIMLSIILDYFCAVHGAHRPPRRERDIVGDELHGAIGHNHIDAARVAAAGSFV